MRALQYDYLRRRVVIAPRVIDTPTVLTGTIDLLGASNVEFEMIAGDVSVALSAALSFSLEHGELADFSDMVAVPDSHLLGTEAALDINASDLIRRIGYKVATGKRYVRVTCTPNAGTVSNLTPTIARAIDPLAWSGLVEVVGPTIDTQGYAYVSVLVPIGAVTWTGAKAVGFAKLQWSDDDSGWSDAPESHSSASDGGAVLDLGNPDQNTANRLTYLASKAEAKRYIRVDLFGGGQTGGSMMIGAEAELINLPARTAFGVIALIRDHHSHQTTEQ